MKVCTFYEEKGRETKHQTMISTAFEIRLFLLKINFVYSKLPEITFVSCKPEPHVPLLNPFIFLCFYIVSKLTFIQQEMIGYL